MQHIHTKSSLSILFPVAFSLCHPLFSLSLCIPSLPFLVALCSSYLITPLPFPPHTPNVPFASSLCYPQVGFPSLHPFLSPYLLLASFSSFIQSHGHTFLVPVISSHLPCFSPYPSHHSFLIFLHVYSLPVTPPPPLLTQSLPNSLLSLTQTLPASAPFLLTCSPSPPLPSLSLLVFTAPNCGLIIRSTHVISRV